jgi:hypothetical protein
MNSATKRAESIPQSEQLNRPDLSAERPEVVAAVGAETASELAVEVDYAATDKAAIELHAATLEESARLPDTDSLTRDIPHHAAVTPEAALLQDLNRDDPERLANSADAANELQQAVLNLSKP